MPIILNTSITRLDDPLRKKNDILLGYLHKPVKHSQLYKLVWGLFGRTTTEIPAVEAVPTGAVLDDSLATQFPMRILVAEDNAINQKVLLRVLQKMGYIADAVGNGVEVLEALQRISYDLIFMDVQMPELDGLEATRRIVEKWPPEARPIIVAMTANVLLADREACFLAGMQDYIGKPIRLNDIQAKIEKYGAAKMRNFIPSK